MGLEVFKEPLDVRVDQFLEWYYLNRISGVYHKFTDQKDQLLLMSDFIEKMAVWYELRYPDYEIKYSIPGSGKKPTCVDSVMFNENSYISDCLKDNMELVWAEFYNTSSFINSLSVDEKRLIMEPRYIDKVYIDRKCGTPYLELDKDGNVIESVNMKTLNKDFDEEFFVGKNIKYVINFLKSKNINLDKDNEFEKAVVDYENWEYQKKQMLNSVMYRIIERGRRYVGPRRAFLFAKEFGLNINIPMIYGVDLEDSDLRFFINDYLKSGGKEDLMCYKNYFSTGLDQPLEMVSIKDILTNKCANRGRYTGEEKALYARLVGSLSNEIDDEKIKEEVKKLRIKRKLEKRKNTH